MADEPIGSVSVQITGDYSALEQSFTAAQSGAQKAGEQIAVAFESSASGASALTSAASAVSASVEDLAAKSGLAGGELNIFRAALQGSLEAGVPVNQALAEIAASSTSLGTSVATAAESLSRESVAATSAATANAQLGGSFKEVGTGVDSTDASLKKFADDVQNFISHPLQSAGDSAKEFILALGPTGGVAIAAAAGLALVGKEVFGLVQEFGRASEATGNMADRLNLTWRETRNLEEMAQIAGVSITGLQQASFRMAEALDGTSANGRKVADALASIGVSGNTSGELLTGFLQKLAQIPDDTQRIAIAHEVLGRSSQQILPLIKNYGELQQAIRDLGPAIGDKLAGDLQKSDDAFDKLAISWSRFKEEIAASAAPAVGALVDQLRIVVVESSKLVIETAGSAKALAEMIPAGLVSGLGEVAKAIIDIQILANPFISGIRLMIAGLEDFNIAARAVSGKAAADMATGVETMDKAMRGNLTQSLHAATTGTKEFIDIWKNAGGGVAQQIDNIISSQSKLAGNVRDAKVAYDTLNDAFRTGKPLADGHKVTLEEVTRALANMKAAEQSASLTKKEHTEHVKELTHALPPLSDSVKIFTEQISKSEAAHKSLITAAAGFGELLGHQVTVWEAADIKARAAATGYKVFLETFNETPNFSAMFDKFPPILDTIAESLKKDAQAALDTDPYAKLEKALEDLGIKGAAYYKKEADDAERDYNIVLNSGVATYEELAQAALKSAEAQIRAELAVGDISREEADNTLKQIQGDLDNLDASHTASAQKRGKTERTLAQEIQGLNRDAFRSIEGGLAHLIVEHKGFSKIWHDLWQQLAEKSLTVMMDGLFKPLEKQIGILLGKIPGLGGGGGGSSAPGVPGVPGTGGGGGAGGALGSASSGVTGILTSVFTGVTAASSVVGNFQNAHMETTLNAIEGSTRYLMIGLVTQGDSLLNDGHVIRNTLTTFMAWNWGVATTYFQGISEKLDTIIGMGGIHPTSQAAVAKMTTEAASRTPSDAKSGGDIVVNIDKVSPDVTDAKVRDTFNRGIRLSKLAGAFRPGVFPQ